MLLKLFLPLLQSFLKHKDAKPLRDVLAANPNRFITLLLPIGTPAAVRPGSPSTTTMRLDLQFQAIKVLISSSLSLHWIVKTSSATGLLCTGFRVCVYVLYVARRKTLVKIWSVCSQSHSRKWQETQMNYAFLIN